MRMMRGGRDSNSRVLTDNRLAVYRLTRLGHPHRSIRERDTPIKTLDTDIEARIIFIAGLFLEKTASSLHVQWYLPTLKEPYTPCLYSAVDKGGLLEYRGRMVTTTIIYFTDIRGNARYESPQLGHLAVEKSDRKMENQDLRLRACSLVF